MYHSWRRQELQTPRTGGLLLPRKIIRRKLKKREEEEILTVLFTSTGWVQGGRHGKNGGLGQVKWVKSKKLVILNGLK